MVSRFWVAILVGTVVVAVNARYFDRDLSNRFLLDQSLIDRLKELELVQSHANQNPSTPHEVRGWDHIPVGQVGGLAVDKNSDLYVFHRAGRIWDYGTFNGNTLAHPEQGPIDVDVINKWDSRTGNVLDHFGKGKFYMPHGITVDKDGNVWVTDVGLHQVMKFPKGSHDANIVLGEALVPGSDDRHFCKPTDVAVASNGDFFVSDGYCNSRIMRFSSNGTLLKTWGQRPTGSRILSDDEFQIPHSLTLIEETDTVCVADRENERIQCFEAGLTDTNRTGIFLRSIPSDHGRIFAISYDPTNRNMYAVTGSDPMGIKPPVGLTMNLNGKLLEIWGPTNTDFEAPHDLAVSPDGRELYVGDIGHDPVVWKFESRI
ncbi:hypothetical protein ACJMK2_043847 [Sinanodonta woodiana]|uniref:peptidylamidoglycolate lyase n=1 Tax=Sinanodonta woodiana TaxID=1069815 RepID=A0ABD3W0Z8_SINWO